MYYRKLNVMLCRRIKSIRWIGLGLAIASSPVYAEPAARSMASEQGAVATVHPLASAAAMQQLERGGNSIDAAIAAALTLGVVDSYNSGIGGGLFALIHWADGRVQAIDAREMAPLQAHRDMYLREGSVVPALSRAGALAIGIPGSVAAFEYLAKQGGKRPLSSLYKDAAALAENGFPVSQELANRLARYQKNLAAFPAAAAIFLDKNQQPWPVGHILQQRDLASTYRALAQQGKTYFYRGEFAQKTAQWMAANGGIITESDFAHYELRLRQPVKSHFNGYEVYGFPPPSSGGVHVAEILSMLDYLDVASLPDAQRRHRLGEAMKLAFADRAHWLGDPDFVNVPKGLIDPAYARMLAAKINPEQATIVTGHHQPPRWQSDWFDKHTTHIAVADKHGNWVAITTTLNTSFGSKVVVPGTGVLMNNQMDDFSARPGVPNSYGLVGSEANSIQPRKRPLSSMSPTIVLRDGKPVMSIGAAGGPMIITQVVQGIMNHLLLGDSLYDSLAKPRVHQQWKPDIFFVDKTLPLATQDYLCARGHQLKQLRFEGSSNAISVRDGQWQAVAEPRLIERNQPVH